VSSGHHHQESPAVSAESINKILANPTIRDKLYGYREENNNFTIPFIAGYSQDRKTIYFDQHLPETITLKHDGKSRDIRPRDHIRPHEIIEPIVMDVLGWTYFPAHAVATAYEKRNFIQRVGPEWWMPYTYAMDGFASGDEHEKITKVPKDLDMAPYLAPPVNRRLVEAMKKAQGATPKEPKALARYVSEGRPAEHCGPVTGWPKGDCEHYEKPNGCEIVQGHIAQRGWCKHWVAA
jgi:hypothetical protein